MNAMTKTIEERATQAVATALALPAERAGATATTTVDLAQLRRDVAAQTAFMVGVIRRQAGDYTPPALEYERPHGGLSDRARLDATVAELRAEIARAGRIAIDMAALI